MGKPVGSHVFPTNIQSGAIGAEPWSRANSQDLPGALATHRPTAVGVASGLADGCSFRKEGSSLRTSNGGCVFWNLIGLNVGFEWDLQGMITRIYWMLIRVYWILLDANRRDFNGILLDFDGMINGMRHAVLLDFFRHQAMLRIHVVLGLRKKIQKTMVFLTRIMVFNHCWDN